MIPFAAVVLSKGKLGSGFRAGMVDALGEDLRGAHGGQESVLATIHTVYLTEPGTDAETPMLGPGRMLNETDAQALGLRLLGNQEHAGEGFVPRELLYRSRRVTAWHVRGERRPMYFRTRGQKTERYEVRWPDLVFAVCDEQLWLAATVVGTRMTGPRTRLYHAPLMNVDAHGLVCLGNATRGDAMAAETDRATWQAAIFETSFSHVNHGQTFAGGATTGEHQKRWREAERSGGRISARDMTPMGQTLEKWIAVLEARRQSTTPA